MEKKIEKYVKLEHVLAVIREYGNYSRRMCNCVFDDADLTNQYFGQSFACSYLESVIMSL